MNFGNSWSLGCLVKIKILYVKNTFSKYCLQFLSKSVFFDINHINDINKKLISYAIICIRDNANKFNKNTFIKVKQYKLNHKKKNVKLYMV